MSCLKTLGTRLVSEGSTQVPFCVISKLIIGGCFLSRYLIVVSPWLDTLKGMYSKMKKVFFFSVYFTTSRVHSYIRLHHIPTYSLSKFTTKSSRAQWMKIDVWRRVTFTSLWLKYSEVSVGDKGISFSLFFLYLHIFTWISQALLNLLDTALLVIHTVSF